MSFLFLLFFSSLWTLPKWACHSWTGLDLKRITLQVHVQRNISCFTGPLLSVAAGSRGWRTLWSAAGPRPGVGGQEHKAGLCVCPPQMARTAGNSRGLLTPKASNGSPSSPQPPRPEGRWWRCPDAPKVHRRLAVLYDTFKLSLSLCLFAFFRPTLLCANNTALWAPPPPPHPPTPPGCGA